MKEETFEDINKRNQEIIKKDFPSIFGKHFIHDAYIGPVFPVYSDSCVIENLIDKQKVRDYWNKFLAGDIGVDYFEKELGMEE